MKKIFTIITFIFIIYLCKENVMAQSDVIRLYSGKAPGSQHWLQQEKIVHDSASGESFAYNVTDPTLTVFMPEPAHATGTAIIVCPGGAFHVLSLDNEGSQVAHWLNSIGITAFVLKYRLAESKTSDPLKELGEKIKDTKKLDEENAPVVPLAIADASTALRYVREHAKEFGVNVDRLGIMGFSAGGTVTAGVAFNYSPDCRPAFVAPIYSYTGALTNTIVPADAPPLFVAAASDDSFGFAPHTIKLYNLWLAAKRSAEIHVFAQGGHGFAMKKLNLPVDEWRTLFKKWLTHQGFL